MGTWVPGEALIIKIWETVTERALGGLLAPWQIKRLARANAQARAQEMLSVPNRATDCRDPGRSTEVRSIRNAHGD